MKWFKKILNLLKTGKITAWQANDKELTEAARPFEKSSPASFEAGKPEGETYKGIKITFPLK